MDQDRMNGSLRQASGMVKQAAGRMTGDAKLKTEGRAETLAGKTQNAMGGMKDAIRDQQTNRDE